MIENLLVEGVWELGGKGESELFDPVGVEGRKGAEKLVGAAKSNSSASVRLHDRRGCADGEKKQKLKRKRKRKIIPGTSQQAIPHNRQLRNDTHQIQMRTPR